MKILVTGGGGYIGSFMTKALLERGGEVVVLDNFSRGNRDFVDSRARVVEGSLLDKAFIHTLFSENTFDAVIHFAAYISMAESVQDPGAYFETNTYGAVNLLEGMRKAEINKIIFSSTAGVYGNPIKVPIPEDHPKNPENPYGESKWMVERVLHWYQKRYGISYAALRYFNAAGADPEGLRGEDHDPETHIIPLAIKAALTGQEFSLFGNDYDTPDGTCVRDYIHVLDLVEAHVLALEYISKNNGGHAFNIGTGEGHSNKEVVEMVKKISGIDFPVVYKERRPGDAGTLVADNSRAVNLLGFNPRYSDLKTIVESAWKWHSSHNR